MYRHFFKRFFDFIISLIGFIVISPIFIFITILLLFANKGKVFFIQQRPGKNEKTFNIIKFKTMNDRKDENGNLLPDKERLTKIGKFVRATSLDEIPQLLNVIMGNMSLIGPRPLLVHHLQLFSPTQARRHEVRPGITGWAQVNGRNLMKLSKKFEYDVWYVDNLTILLDIKILFMTIKNVIARKNIGEGSASMEQIDDLGFMERIKELNLK